MPRPRVNVDPKAVEADTRLGCPMTEIADLRGVSVSTLRRFRKKAAQARAMRRLMLRQFQWSLAKDGSVPMLIFLGKLELGHTEEQACSRDRTIVRGVVKRS